MRKMFWLVVLLAKAVTGVPAAADPGYKPVKLEEVKRIYNAHRALFIDARPFERYRRGTIMGALNLPLHRFKRMKKWLPALKEAPILVFCNGIDCGKSKKLAEKLVGAGYSRVLVYEGGYPEWKRSRLPIMAAPRPCRSDGTERSRKIPVTVDGVTLYAEPGEPRRIDARWIAPMLERGDVPTGLRLVDVRSEASYRRGHLPGAVNLPFDPGTKRLDLSKLPDRGPILFTCRHGTLSTDAWNSLSENLRKRVFILDASVECTREGCSVVPH